MKVGYIGGTLDLYHAGHVNLLKRCKELCDYLVVAINTDEFCKRYKREPIMNEKERFACVESCKYVDYVIYNTGCEDSKKTIKDWNNSHKPSECSSGRKITHVFHGDDWTGDSLKKQMGFTDKWLEKNNIQMVYVDYTKGISTTDIIKRIKQIK
jgi:glycerol-3-phosphate cytidylyltransferase